MKYVGPTSLIFHWFHLKFHCVLFTNLLDCGEEGVFLDRAFGCEVLSTDEEEIYNGRGGVQCFAGCGLRLF